MQFREKILLGSFLGAIVIWQMSGWVSSLLFGPFEERRDSLAGLKKSVTEKTDKKLALVRAEKLLKDWKAKSLPPDDAGKSKQPTALDSGRSYLRWLTDLAQLCEFDSLSVTAGLGGQAVKDNVYIPVVVKIDARARFDQLARFLDLFYRTELLHRISALNVTASGADDDQMLAVKLDAEGLVLIDNKPRRTLFPQTELIRELADDATSLEIADSKDFPKEPGFRIRIRLEFLKVIALNGNRWQVERGIELTTPAAYPSDESVQLVKLDPQKSDLSMDEYRAMIATNIFNKPSPPLKLQIDPISEKSVTRGKSIEFTITATGYDKIQGRPEFVVVSDAPAGLSLDRFGKVTWKPGSDLPAATYVVGFEVRHPSAQDGHSKGSFNIRLREAKDPPKLASAKPPKVYLNHEWSYRPQLFNADSTTDVFSWKLGDRAPQGLKIDSSTGELTWTPGDEVAVGASAIPLLVSDSDTPPQITFLSLPIDVQDDAAQFTRLAGVLAIGEKKRAFLFDASTEKKTELHEGDAFAISDLKGTIKLIGRNYIMLALDQRVLRLEIGESLREALAKLKDN